MPSLLIALLWPDHQFWKYNLFHSLYLSQKFTNSNDAIQETEYIRKHHTQRHIHLCVIFTVMSNHLCVIKFIFGRKHLNFLYVTWQQPHIYTCHSASRVLDVRKTRRITTEPQLS